MFKLPFSVWPASWGLKGKTRARAEAEYYLTGEALERRMIEIDHETGSFEYKMLNLGLDLKYEKISQYEYDLAVLDLKYPEGDTRELARLIVEFEHQRINERDFEMASNAINYKNSDRDRVIGELGIKLRHGEIDRYTHDIEVAKATHAEDSVDLKVALHGIDLAAGKITQHQHDKEVATLQGKPYIGVIDSEYDPELGVNGLYFELDWNDKFIDTLTASGYTGFTDRMIVDRWFEDICRSIGDDTDEATDAFVTSASHVRVFRREDGKTEIG